MCLFGYVCKDKVKFLELIQHVPMKITAIIGAIAVAVLFFFSFIFGLAASVQATTTRLTVSVLLFVVGFALAYVTYLTVRKPKTVIYQVEVSGEMKTAALKCPKCSASVDANKIKIISGVPYATCNYCGSTFEVTEAPKW
jgi:hypothetical protein